MTYDPRKGVQKVATTAALSSLSNPQDGDLVITLDDGLVKKYNASRGQWNNAVNGFIDPAQFGNWVPVEVKQFNAAPVTGSFLNLNGDADNRYMLVVSGSLANNNGNMNLKFNSDSGSNYMSGYTYYYDGTGPSGGTARPSSYIQFQNNANVGNTIQPVSIEMIIDAKSGKGRSLFWRQVAGIGTASMIGGIGFGQWNDISSNITSINLNQNTAVNFTGTITLYKWQDIKPVELATYELVKEYNFTTATQLNDVLAWDGEVDDRIHIEYQVRSASAGAVNPLLVRPNNSSAASYDWNEIRPGNNTISGLYTGSMTGLPFAWYCNTANSNFSGTFDAYLKVNNMHRGSINNAVIDVNDGGYTIGSIMYGKWWDTTTKITSIGLYSPTAITGVIRVYKLAKAALISSNPNLLTTYSKSVDNNTIEVQPGEIEINGTICQVTKPTQVTLSGNLQAGLTEAANTIYYLYAVKGTGRSVTYMFSTTAPTMDRYGNVVASFNLCNKDKAWFHPTLGLNYRWIGQVLNNASSNITPFDKMKPGYFESPWYAVVVGQRTLDHGLGRVPLRYRLLFSTDSAGATVNDHVPYFIASAGADYGTYLNYAPSTSSTITIYTDNNNGIFMPTAGNWTVSGYQKHIVEFD